MNYQSPNQLPGPQTVIVLVGQIGSGKSTYAKTYYPHYTRLSGDILKTSKKIVSELKKALDRGESVVVDATNVTLERRRDIITECKTGPMPLKSGQPNYRQADIKIYAVVFRIDMDICMERAKTREAKGVDEQGQPIPHIPAIAFYKLNKSFVDPTLAEGFDFIGEIK